MGIDDRIVSTTSPTDIFLGCREGGATAVDTFTPLMVVVDNLPYVRRWRALLLEAEVVVVLALAVKASLMLVLALPAALPRRPSLPTQQPCSRPRWSSRTSPPRSGSGTSRRPRTRSVELGVLVESARSQNVLGSRIDTILR